MIENKLKHNAVEHWKSAVVEMSLENLGFENTFENNSHFLIA